MWKEEGIVLGGGGEGLPFVSQEGNRARCTGGGGGGGIYVWGK